MRLRGMIRLVGASMILLGLASSALAARWITPDWPESGEPRFAPVPLYWFTISECPIVYRTELTVPPDATRATALLRTSGYVFVCVDGRQLYAWAPRPEDRQNNRPAIPADPNRVHPIDLTEHLTPGKHVLTVSAPARGFILDGAIYAGANRLLPIETTDAWTATKFAPTTILEDQPIMKPGYTGPAVKVKPADQWKADEDALTRANTQSTLKRLRRDLDDAIWRLELLRDKGIYIDDDQACGWGGPQRTLVRFLPLIDRQLDSARKAAEELTALEPQLAAAQPPEPLRLQLQALIYRVASIAKYTQATSIAAAAFDRKTADDLLAALGDAPDHPRNRLNESRFDRLGWLPHPGLTDSRVGQWGVRLNPVTGPTRLRAPSRWLFATDPNNTGEKELRWSIGYNIENQMDRIDVPRSWTQVAKYANYRGPAWYRTRVQVPDQWAGNPVILKLRIAGTEKLWVNDREVTSLGAGAADRVYQLPADLIAYGAENFIAVKVDARDAQRGIVGPVELSCPTLDAPEAKNTPAVDILATPLSPCVVLRPKTDTIQIHHAGQGKLMLPGDAAPARAAYAPAADGALKANWALLWLEPGSAAGVERPILLVFRANPAAIACEPGLTRITLNEPARQVIAVRPWAKSRPTSVQESVAFWSRAALAVPLNYLSVTRVLRPAEPCENISIDRLPKGPRLAQTVLYDYLLTQDEWKTEPLKIAPLPALCSYALDTRFRTLTLDQPQSIETFQDGGLVAPYRAIRNADRITYSYEVEPFPRFIGFTSWMFSWADAGVPGNQREMETIAAIGANSYRPQHNWSDQRPGQYERGRWVGHFPESEKRSRVQITADYCNAVGLNYMNNIEQTLDKHQLCREDYDTWLTTILYPHFAKLVPQLKDRPFWAAAYDLINEPFDHKAPKYNPAMRQLTRQIRAADRNHLLYIEPCQAWGAIQQLALIQPTGDPLTVYSFHDYNFRLNRAADRWPTAQRDITSICQMWFPAFEFQIRNSVPMHCGEFGGFASETNDNLSQTLLLNDFFRLFDQFGMHHHYYSGREIYQRLADGSLRPSNVVRAYRAYLRRGHVNAYYARWPGHPEAR